MDHRNENATPLDRIDEEFFRRMLSDEGYEIGRGRTADDNDYPGFRGLRESYDADADNNGSSSCSICGSGNASREAQSCGCTRNSSAYGNRGIRGREDNGYGTRNNGCTTCRRNNSNSDNGSSRIGSNTSDNGFTVPRLEGVPLSMVYSPYQEWKNLYEPDEGLEHGTIFMDLDFPFYPTPCNNDGCRKCRN